MALGDTMFWLGNLPVAHHHLTTCIALYDPGKHRLHGGVFGQDPCLLFLSYDALALWSQGLPDQGLERSRTAVSHARTLKHPFSLSYALYFAVVFSVIRREPQRAQEALKIFLGQAAEQGYSTLLELGGVFQGWVLASYGHSQAGLASLRNGIAGCRTRNYKLATAFFHALLAEIYWRNQQVDEGLTTVTQGLVLSEQTSDYYYKAELLRLRGELLFKKDG